MACSLPGLNPGAEHRASRLGPPDSGGSIAPPGLAALGWGMARLISLGSALLLMTSGTAPCNTPVSKPEVSGLKTFSNYDASAFEFPMSILELERVSFSLPSAPRSQSPGMLVPPSECVGFWGGRENRKHWEMRLGQYFKLWLPHTTAPDNMVPGK